MTIPIQLALQGGGAKITYLIAALEALQSLEREGLLRVTRIAGTSAGAIAGALYAAGVDMKRARDTFEAERDDLLRAFPPADGSLRAAWCLLTRRPFWNAEPLRRVLAKLLAPHAHLGDLAIPLVVVASDLTNMQPCVYDGPSEPLLASLLDSAGIPFFFRTPPATGDAYRVIVDGGVCENLPCDRLSYNAEEGEVVGISFAGARAGAPVHGSLAFSRALFETALNASELRAHLALGPNNFVIRTDAGTFDFPRAFTTGLGAEYRETRLLAEEFFRRYADRTLEAEGAAGAGEPRDGYAKAQLPIAQLPQMIEPLRNWYRHQERTRFELLSVSMVITAEGNRREASGGPVRPAALVGPARNRDSCSTRASSLWQPNAAGRTGPPEASRRSPSGVDDVRQEIVFRPSVAPIHSYKINLTSPWTSLNDGYAQLFDRNCDPVPFDPVPVTEGVEQTREVLLLFREPLVPGDERAPFTLRIRDTIPGALRLAKEGRDELLITRATRADRPIGCVEIVVHLPEELSDAVIVAAPGSSGKRMTRSELMRHPAPAGFITLGWKAQDVAPDIPFGCNLIRNYERRTP
jgi:predicted acylesterase/phospholipase RssA